MKMRVCVASRASFASSFDCCSLFFFFQAEDGIRDLTVTGVQTCALPISRLPPKVSALLCAPGARFRADATDASATAGRTRAGSCCPRGSPQALPRHRPRAAPGGPLRVRPVKRRRRLRRAAGTDVCSCLYSCVAWDCKLPLSLSKCFRVQLRGARSDSHSLPLPAAALLTDTKHFEIV